MRPDALLYADTPSMDAVIQSGVFNFDTIVEEDTISGPSWASILTGLRLKVKQASIVIHKLKMKSLNVKKTSLQI